MTVGQDSFFGPEFDEHARHEQDAAWRQQAAERADRVHHLVARLLPMAPPMEGEPAEIASWVLNQVTADGSKGLLFQIDSVLSLLMEAEHARLRTVVEQVMSHGPEERAEVVVRALLIEIGYEGD